MPGIDSDAFISSRNGCLKPVRSGREPSEVQTDMKLRTQLATEFEKYFSEGPRRFLLGFHGDYYLIRLVYHFVAQAENFIETGTSSAASLTQIARAFPETPCFSCELLDSSFISASRKVAALPNVHIHKSPSPEFLYRLLDNQPELASSRTAFWLDAHANEFPCPLADEVKFITARFDEAAIFIDDFQVPGRPDFEYDTYKNGISLTWDYIYPSLNVERSYKIGRPNYTKTTSLHHPLRGWIMISWGHWDFVPDDLKEYYAFS